MQRLIKKVKRDERMTQGNGELKTGDLGKEEGKGSGV